jgi:hypothetical protein
MVLGRASKSPLISNESTRQTMLKYVGHGLVRAFMALTAFNLATILAPVSAMAEPLDVSAGQEVAGGQGTAPDSTRENNGFDITCPQTSFEVCGLGETSSNNTSKTNEGEAPLRVESKILLMPAGASVYWPRFRSSWPASRRTRAAACEDAA